MKLCQAETVVCLSWVGDANWFKICGCRLRQIGDLLSKNTFCEEGTRTYERYHISVIRKITKGPDTLSDSVEGSDQLQRETSGAEQWNQFQTDFTGPLRSFPVATDLITRLSQKIDRDLNSVWDLFSSTSELTGRKKPPVFGMQLPSTGRRRFRFWPLRCSWQLLNYSFACTI